ARADRLDVLEGPMPLRRAVEHDGPQLAAREVGPAARAEHRVADPQRPRLAAVIGTDEEALIVPFALGGPAWTIGPGEIVGHRSAQPSMPVWAPCLGRSTGGWGFQPFWRGPAPPLGKMPPPPYNLPGPRMNPGPVALRLPHGPRL